MTLTPVNDPDDNEDAGLDPDPDAFAAYAALLDAAAAEEDGE